MHSRPRFRAPSVLTGVLVAWFALLLVVAIRPLSASADTLDDGVRRIAKQLRCPICESVSVADSPAELAGQMRGVIRRKLEAGETDQQILDYFVAAYGDSVLLDPPRRGLGWVVWLGPLLALAAGGVIVWLILRVWVRPFQASAGHHKDFSIEFDPASQAIHGRLGPVDSRPDETSPSALAARARQELDAVRKGLAR